MRIATWNVNGLRARLDFVLHWLRARQPDVVGLQELKLTDEQFPTDVFEAEGYGVVSHGQKAWNGVAILSREEAVLTQRGLPGQEAFGARLISARVGGLAFTTVYCPNGKHVGHDDFPKKLTWFNALAGHLASTVAADTASVLCGDFNVGPTALDSWNGDAVPGAIFHTDEERARHLTRVADAAGFGLEAAGALVELAPPGTVRILAAIEGSSVSFETQLTGRDASTLSAPRD